MANKATTPKIHVLADTNFLFVESENQLVSDSSARFMKQIGADLGLEVYWYAPSVVIGERRRQMTAEAKKLLPHLRRMESLLGMDFNAKDDLIAYRIEEIIKREITDVSLREIELNYDGVQWKDVVDAAIYRLPPFSNDKTEKGFKDALILAAFKQQIGNLPVTPKNCRIFVFSGDGLLGEACKALESGYHNVSLVTSKEDLRTRLAAIAAHLSEEDLEKILPRAKKMFFYDAQDKTSLYYALGVGKWISNDGKLSANRPAEGYSTSVTKITIDAPSFVKKSKQSVTFSTPIRVVLTSTRNVPKLGNVLAAPSLSGLSTQEMIDTINKYAITSAKSTNALANLSSASLAAIPSASLTSALSGLQPTLEYETVVAQSDSLVTVEWSATLTQAGNLVKAEIKSITPHIGQWKTQ